MAGLCLYQTQLGACALVWQGAGRGGGAGLLLPAAGDGPFAPTVARRFAGAVEAPMPPAIADAAARVTRLLAGQVADHRELLAVPLDPAGWAQLGDFPERATLQLTREIPVGQTRTYGERLRCWASPALRAVGSRVAQPFAPIVPCHRVMGAAGAPTGFGAGRGRDQTPPVAR